MPKLLERHKKAKLINLIPQDEFEKSTVGRVLKWALSTFRIMVILTELVVMGAFLSRFWLDARNSDLNEILSVRKSQVLAYKEIETEFRSYQEKLQVVSSLYSNQKISELILSISKYLPNDVSLSSVSFLDNTVQIKATSFSERSIAQFITNLEQNKEFTDLSLGQLSSSQDNSGVTIFTVNGKITTSKGGQK